MPLPCHTLPVLIYKARDKPDTPVCALALELDLRGYGKSDEEALDQLSQLLIEQFALARHMGQPHVLTIFADEEFWERHEKARRWIVLKGLAPLGDRVADVPVPSPEMVSHHANSKAAAQVH
jgi:hypothetical protein